MSLLKQSIYGTVMDNPFDRLSTDCLYEILSRTSPLDASRFAKISKGFKSVADSDTVWDRFLPTEIVSRAVSPEVLDGTKKSLFLNLCDRHILLDSGKLNFFLDKRSGKKFFMVGARELIISWGETKSKWRWPSHESSRFSEVAHLISVCGLDVRGKINTRMLSQRTVYSVYLVYRLARVVIGLESVSAVIRFVDQETDKDAEERARLLHLDLRHPKYRSPMTRQTEQLPIQRDDDGWLEIKMGEFYNYRGDEGEVEARLLEIWHLHEKSGLIVQGIEFRPRTMLYLVLRKKTSRA